MSLLPENIHPSWNNLLTDNFVEKLDKIEQKLNKLPIHKIAKHRYFPETKNVMRFLQQDLTNVKYVILGMDPYPSWYEKDGEIIPVATGRSFEVGNVDTWQQKFKQNSLQNLVKTVYYNKTSKKKNLTQIREELANDVFKLSPPHKWFDKLEAQGVLFLNATLTVEPDNADTHRNHWRDVMTNVIQYIENDHDMCWLLFGDKAGKRILETIPNYHHIEHCCHPRLAKFVDANIFSVASDIEWCI